MSDATLSDTESADVPRAIANNRYAYLSAEEQGQLKTPSDLQGFLGFAVTWIVIIGCFILVAYWPNPFSILIALTILGGRQLALGILLHDCSHRSWFKTSGFNEFFGHWFAGIPVLVPLLFYRDYHFIHHTKTGTNEDPDVGNIKSYPVSKASMRRKMMRDFVGLTGIKNMIALLLYVNTGRPGNAVSMGAHKKKITGRQMLKISVKNYSHLFLFHGLCIAIFTYLGHPALYFLWWAAFIFTYPFIMRVRQIAEHGAMPILSSTDVRDNTRTTLPAWWERIFFAPHRVNYHCEHHYIPTVPGYNLPKMHALMRARGFYQSKEAALAYGYRAAFQRAILPS